MSNPSPTCLVNSASTVNGANVASSSTVNVALASVAGVNQWGFQCIQTDESTSPAAVNATLAINATAKTATFSAPGTLGVAMLFQSVVGVNGLGVDANKKIQASYTTTFGVFVLSSGGLRVLATNQSLEGSLAYGWIVDFNALVRSGGSAYAPTLVTLTGGGSATANTTGAQVTLVRATNTSGATSITDTGSSVDGAQVRIMDVASAGSFGAHAASFVPRGTENAWNPATGAYGAVGVAATLTANFASGMWTRCAGSSLWTFSS